MDQIAITTEGLTRDFAGVRALDHLDLEVPQGIVFGFLGPNGSGKTTTIRLLLGLLEPTSGAARVLGYDTRTQAELVRSQCGALLEHTGLYERLSAADNLEFYGRVWRLPPAERRARARELLEHVALWERRREPVSAWSRGMQQKLAVARALLHRPSLLFLDEPTAGLDPVAAAALRDDLASLTQREGVTVFLTTHNLVEAERLCARVAVISRGKLLAVGSPAELRLGRTSSGRGGASRLEVIGRGATAEAIAALHAHPGVTAVAADGERLAIDIVPGTDTAVLVSALVQAGMQVDEVRRGRASLEDVFLSLVEEEQA